MRRFRTDNGEPERLSADDSCNDHDVLLSVSKSRSIESDIEAGIEDIDTGEAGVDRESDIDEVEGETDREEGSNEVVGREGVVGRRERWEPDRASSAMSNDTA